MFQMYKDVWSPVRTTLNPGILQCEPEDSGRHMHHCCFFRSGGCCQGEQERVDLGSLT